MNHWSSNIKELEQIDPALAFHLSLSGNDQVFGEEPILFYSGISGCNTALQWVYDKEGRHLYLFEEDLNALRSLLDEEKIDFKCITLINHVEKLKEVLWKTLLKKTQIVGTKKEVIQALQRGVQLVFADYRDFGIEIETNLIKNMGRVSYDGDALKNAFKDIPALVCGAGPSFLESVVSDEKALVFAGGTALSLCHEKNVRVDFGAYIDPKPDKDPFFTSNTLGIPLCFQSRFDATLLEKWEGMLLNFDGLEPGWNVGNFITHIALYLGCNPITFVGMDLSETQADLLTGKEWLEALIAQHPQTTFVNATQGGLPIRGCRAGFETNRPIPDVKKVLSELPLKTKSDMRSDLLNSLLETKQICERYLEKAASKKTTALEEVELEEELFYQRILSPNWMRWEPLIEGSKTEEILFYQTIIQDYQEKLFKC